MKKVSLIITVLNEENSIIELLESARLMTLVPNEIIIVDGGSSDDTISLIKNYRKKYPSLLISYYLKKGNRSVGRNYAIKKAKNNWIAITDAGCILDKNWLAELMAKQKELGTDVVAGYYKAIPTTKFEEAVVPYVLVMPDKVDEENFLPATRSVLLNKKVWKSVGEFDEKLSDNEDYAFAKKLKGSNISKFSDTKIPSFKIGFAKNAVVSWVPRSTLKDFSKMIFRFARGDVYAGIVRPKVLLIFARYVLGGLVFIWGFDQLKNNGIFWILFGIIPLLLGLYILWSIVKNYRHASRSWYFLPVLQITSDLAVMWGSACGFFKRLK